MARESDVTKIGFLVMTLETRVCSGLSPSAITLVAMSLSVTMPERRALVSVRRTASTRREAILRHASRTVVPSGMVRALDRRSFLTVLSMSETGSGRGEPGLGEVVSLKLLFPLSWVWRTGFLEADEPRLMLLLPDEVMFMCNDPFNQPLIYKTRK